MTEQEISAANNLRCEFDRAEVLGDVVSAWWELNYENQELKERLQNVVNAAQQSAQPDSLKSAG